MKKYTPFALSFAVLLLTFLGSCGINNQARQIKALEKCTYRIVDVQDVTVSGVDFSKIFQNDEINLSAIPSIALGLLTKDVPLRSTVMLEITNPTLETAAINQFEYIVQIGREELVNGVVQTPLTIDAGAQVTVPVQINTNIHRLVTNKEMLNQVMEAYRKRNSNTSLGALTIKLKPTFKVGNGYFKYPGYINIKKDIELSKFFSK